VDITVHCPQCGNRYHLKPEMRGKRTRCPNALCRAVFEVRDEAETLANATEAPTAPPSARRAGPPAEPNYRVGAVGDLVPLLTVENAEEPPATPAPDAPVADATLPPLAEEVPEPKPNEMAW
jgi:hypothetical protein